MKKRLLAGLATGLFVFGMVGMAHATLVGDSVTSHYLYGTIDPTGDNTDTVAVTADASDLMFPSFNGYFTVDVNADYFTVDVNAEGRWHNGLFHGLLLESLDDTSGDPLPSVNVVTNILDFNASLAVEQGADWVSIDFGDYTTALDSFITVSWNYGVVEDLGGGNDEMPGGDPVPEPATMLLFGTGLAGLAGSRIRRKKK